jgi:RNA polymerase sigma-70 factor (ECF subfamily)
VVQAEHWFPINQVYTDRVVANSPGDSGSFAELAMPHFASLYNLAFWLTQDRAAAEDLVQETYVKALKGFPSYHQGTNFRAWMYRILRNTFLTTQAGLKAAVSLDSDDVRVAEPATDETPEVVLLTRAEQETIRKALEALPMHFREIILLTDLEEMNYKEVGLALNVPVGTVMSRLFRARKAMRTLLLAAASQGAKA